MLVATSKNDGNYGSQKYELGIEDYIPVDESAGEAIYAWTSRLEKLIEMKFIEQGYEIEK